MLLDYVSEFSIFAIVKSFRNRDFIVFVTLVVSIIIKVLIVLSSGLISFQLVNVTRDCYLIVLENKFVDNSAKLARAGTLAGYVITGLESRNLTLPEGISGEYAFQSARTNLSDILETRVITDGLRNSLRCEAAQLNLVGVQLSASESPNPLLNVTLSSPDCNVALASLEGAAGGHGGRTIHSPFKRSRHRVTTLQRSQTLQST